MDRKGIAFETLQILEQGSYQSPSGRSVDIAADLLACVTNTECHTPNDLAGIRDQVLQRPAEYDATFFEVENETTLRGSARLAASHVNSRIGVLNFASAKNPGGGFRGGAQAQEESLARSSGLYPSLLQGSPYYRYHRSHRNLFYSDHMIYSPGCPVFRNDGGSLLEQPYLVNFITSPAPNAGAMKQASGDLAAKLQEVFSERASKLLGLAIHQGCDVLVLGAWGCGVFRNDPAMVSQVFWELLGPDMPYEKRFQTVAFSVMDRSQDQRTYNVFLERFSASQ